MKRTILFLLFIFAVIDAGVMFILWPKPKAEEAPSEEPRITVSRDAATGDTILTMSDEVQGEMGIQITNPPSGQLVPELKAYGRVLDPAPLAALMTELAAAQTTYSASSNELARLKALVATGNASERALQTAEATAKQNQLAIQSAKERLTMSWGKALAEQPDLPGFIRSLASLDSALVRVDLPIGETLKSPGAARISSLSGNECAAEYLGVLPSVDPQMQGRGFLFQIKSNSAQIAPGEAVLAWLRVPGEPLNGVIIPRPAVVRTEGLGWVYVFEAKGNGESFTRTQIALDHPTDTGWFVHANGLAPTNYIVIDGAQRMLSAEQNGGGAEE